jgi:hypothetical protein
MARRTFDVVDIIEILVHWHAGRNNTEIAASLDVDRKSLLAPFTLTRPEIPLFDRWIKAKALFRTGYVRAWRVRHSSRGGIGLLIACCQLALVREDPVPPCVTALAI